MRKRINKWISDPIIFMPILCLGLGLISLFLGLKISSFYLIIIGVILISFNLFNLIYSMCFPEKDGKTQFKSCSICFIVFFALTLLAAKFDKKRYITSEGHRQHLYKDCPSIRNSRDVKEIFELEGFFHLCFFDCKICKEQKKIKKKQRMEEEKQQEEYEREDEELDIDELPPNGVPSKYW